MEQVKQIDLLFELLDQRDRAVEELNVQIVRLIGPTLLTAISEMLELGPENILVSSIAIADNMLLLDLLVSYEYNDNMSYWLKAIDSVGVSTTDQRTRLVRTGIPVETVFDSADNIKQFLARANAQDKTEPEPEPKLRVTKQHPKVNDFDPEDLTEDQAERLLLFQHTIPKDIQ